MDGQVPDGVFCQSFDQRIHFPGHFQGVSMRILVCSQNCDIYQMIKTIRLYGFCKLNGSLCDSSVNQINSLCNFHKHTLADDSHSISNFLNL